MNILITLPKDLLKNIINGKKRFEMRKCIPKNMKIGEDGFFVVEKGTDNVRCWCRVDEIREESINYFNVKRLAHLLCVSENYIIQYAKDEKVYLWKIGKVIMLEDLKRHSLFVDKNPQQFAYCNLSYGESY